VQTHKSVNNILYKKFFLIILLLLKGKVRWYKRCLRL